jgi:hypothetical protein
MAFHTLNRHGAEVEKKGCNHEFAAADHALFG